MIAILFMFATTLSNAKTRYYSKATMDTYTTEDVVTTKMFFKIVHDEEDETITFYHDGERILRLTIFHSYKVGNYTIFNTIDRALNLQILIVDDENRTFILTSEKATVFYTN